MKIEKIGFDDYNHIMTVWESSVKMTHDFLKPGDFEFYKQIIPTDYLPNIDVYVLRSEGHIRGFIGVSGEHLEMLFISGESRGKGYGKKLLTYAVRHLGIHKTDVNEQNIQAVGFYEKFGFKVTGRSEKDSMNKEYPILHLSL